MLYFQYLIKMHLSQIAIVVCLFLWGASSTLYAFSNKSELVLIGIDANGTRIITNKEDPLYKTEVVNFIRRFFSLLYNFDTESFEENVGAATDLMSIELWNTEEAKITKLQEYVKSEKVSHSGAVQSITKLKDGRFQIVLRTSEMHRMKSTDQDIIVTVSLRPTSRTKANPWGMEVANLEEEKL